MQHAKQATLEKIDDYRWRIPKSYKTGMRVDGIIYTNQNLLEHVKNDRAAEQVANVATLPGIVKHSLAMPDIHWGYGFPIGGVAATDIDEGGVISPGGVGFDINCGVRLVRSNLTQKDIEPRINELVHALYNNIPAGVGSEGNIRVSAQEEKKILKNGAEWAISKGFGTKEDLECTEENGKMEGADPSGVSERAYKRGKKQSGTLGSGNHFTEVQYVDEIYDENIARIFGVEKGQVTVMIHSGSRGFGYQICDEYSKGMGQALQKYGISVPDRQLACAPVKSPEGQAYISSMKCAANYAWNNRQCLMHLVREVFEKVFNRSFSDLGLDLVYDVAHNIAKFEKYNINGKEKLLCVHRKGATRAFPPGHPDLPLRYKESGQPVIIPGDMGRFSFIAVGTKRAEETFYSACHGAGRLLSRKAAISACRGRSIAAELEKKGIVVMATDRSTLAEEAPEAYKNVSEVINVVEGAGIARKVARFRPICVIKG
ncbi:MAG: RtcB family protein [Candidatus Omnitrophota bacterium]